MSEPLLAIRDLTTAFPGPRGWLRAVDGLDLTVDAGEMLGLVGESGCGKSLTALSVMGLVPPPGRVVDGSIRFQGEELRGAPPSHLRRMRGRDMAMIFQEPMTSLNPIFSVGDQVAEVLRVHGRANGREARDMAVEALAQVGIPDPARRAESFPHQLSGGMRQRVMIAMALIMKPALVLADEPTTALDVTIQAQIMGLLARLQEQTGAAVLMITHNLAVVAQLCARVAVMYTGRVVETSPVEALFDDPLHPYTQGLMACLPSRSTQRQTHLAAIGGMVPSLDELPLGCKFSDRCPRAFDRCERAEPGLVEVAPDHWVRCFLHHDQARLDQRSAA